MKTLAAAVVLCLWAALPASGQQPRVDPERVTRHVRPEFVDLVGAQGDVWEIRRDVAYLATEVVELNGEPKAIEREIMRSSMLRFNLNEVEVVRVDDARPTRDELTAAVARGQTLLLLPKNGRLDPKVARLFRPDVLVLHCDPAVFTLPAMYAPPSLQPPLPSPTVPR